jgi:O-antigen ligase
VTTFALAAMVALLPLLVPRGPGNTAPADVFAAMFLLLALLALAQRGRRLRVPAPGAIALILVGSVVALALSSQPAVGVLTLLVDVYLLLLFIMITNHLGGGARAERLLRLILIVWTVAALAWAAVLLAAYFELLPRGGEQLLQIRADSRRAAGASRNNPNLAGSYMVTSFFVLLASPWPRSRPVRLLAAGWLLWALFLTGSLGALLGFVAGCATWALGIYLRSGRTTREVQALAGVAVLLGALVLAGLVVAAGVPRLGLAHVNTVSEDAKGGVLDNSVGRAGKSFAGRLALWSEAVIRAGPRVVVGVGPGEAKSELQISNGSLNPRTGALSTQSMHSDFLGFLIERGILGVAGLLLLYAALLRRVWRVLLVGRHHRIGVAALGIAVVANAAHSLFHETFHFRHVIVLFGLLWVAAELTAPTPEPAATPATSAAPEELDALARS